MHDPKTLAWMEFEAGSLRLAIQFSQYALVRDDEDGESWYVLAHSLARIGDYDGAIDALENLALLRPLDTGSRIVLAIAYGATGRRQLSRDLLMSIATATPVTAEDLLRIATGLEAIDEPRLAMEACRQAGRRSPQTAEVHYQMGYYALRCGHPWSVCEALMRHALHLEPNSVHYRIGLASLLIRCERQREALRILDTVVPTQLGQITCTCCLKRIANLFFDCHDLTRARLCAQRLASLQLDDLPFNARSPGFDTQVTAR